jgi:hypothetical protein
MRPRLAIAGLALIGAIALVVSLLRSRPLVGRTREAIAIPAAPIPAPERARSAATLDLMPPPAQRPGAARTPSADEKRAHDQVVLDGVRRFQFAVVPLVDGCLGGTPAPRVPQPVLVTFRRQVNAADDVGSDRFVAAHVEAVPRQGVRLRSDGSVARCLQRLEGQPLSLASGNAPPGDEFRQIVTLFLPVQPAP